MALFYTQKTLATWHNSVKNMLFFYSDQGYVILSFFLLSSSYYFFIFPCSLSHFPTIFPYFKNKKNKKKNLETSKFEYFLSIFFLNQLLSIV